MKKFFIISLIVLMAGTLAAVFIYTRIYNKPHADIFRMKADYSVSAEAILGEFQTNETAANKKYLDKVVQVEGKIRGIDTADGVSVIVLGKDGAISSVRCNMDPAENKRVISLKKGQDLKLKGMCTGFLLDVILVRAVIVD